jgi:hypothetical protein
MPAFEVVTRLGFAARGLMYGAIGWLAIVSGRTEDAKGIIGYLEHKAGAVLVAIMAAGFFSYAAWRFLEAWLDTEDHGRDAKGVAVRLGGAGSGLIHLGLGVAAILAAFHARRGSGDGPESGAAMALSLPGGEWLLYLAAAVAAGAGIQQFRKAWLMKFLRHFKADAAKRAWIGWLGRIGYAARGCVFLIVGWLLLGAARTHSAGVAGGIDDAIGSLPRLIQLAVAAGVLLFGLFSLTEAAYRRVEAARR